MPISVLNQPFYTVGNNLEQQDFDPTQADFMSPQANDSAYYQDRFTQHAKKPNPYTTSVTSQVAQFSSSPIFSTKSGNSDGAPGYWGQGIALQRAQAAAGQWSLTKGFKGPFDSTSTYDPTQAGVVLSKGGHGANEHTLSVSAGANVGNLEERVYDLFYSGPSTAGVASYRAPNVGTGVGGGGGIEAREDLVDQSLGANLSVGHAKIGDKEIDNLVNLTASEYASIGAQEDAAATLYIGHKGAGIGGGANAFAGAQVGGFAQGSIDGVGASAVGQAWAGLGAKADFEASYSHGKLNLDGGFGAALGLGGYFNMKVTVNFAQIMKEIEGVGDEGVKLAHKWGKKAGVAGEVAGMLAGTADGTLKLGEKTAESVASTPKDVVQGAGKAMKDVVDKMEDI